MIRTVGYGRRMTERYHMPGRMPLSATLLFACVVATLFLTRAGTIAPRHEHSVPRPSTVPQAVEPPAIPSLPGPARDRYEAAERMAAQGQLHAAQDAYLGLLLMNPNDTLAMQGLVTVQR